MRCGNRFPRLFRHSRATTSPLRSYHVVPDDPGVVICRGTGWQAKVVHVRVAEVVYPLGVTAAFVVLRAVAARVRHNSSVPDGA